MSPELTAQKEKVRAIWEQLQMFRSKRALKSKAYRDLETALRQETDRYNAMLEASSLPKE